MIKRPKVVCLFDCNGCCFWRVYQPIMEAHKQGLIQAKFLQLRTSSKQEVFEAVKDADVIHSLGLMQIEFLTLMRQWQSLGVKIVIDYDDLHYNVSPFNTAYRKFGLSDVQVKDPTTGEIKYLWKDGTNGFSIKENKLRFHAYAQTLSEADLITTTTIYLKDAMLEIQPNANVQVLPNAVDLERWKPLDIRDKYKDEFRFGWAVSGSHGPDWIYIRPVLLEFLKKHPKAKFICIGDTYMDIKEGLHEVKDQIEWYNFSDLWEGHYSYMMPMLGLDVAIAPLADLEFNKCKSPLKFVEYTAFGWPVIASKMLPYSECMLHGENGLLAETHEDWLRCLEALYSNKEQRRKLRFNAMFTVKALFDLKEVAKDYAKMYNDILTGVEVK